MIASYLDDNVLKKGAIGNLRRLQSCLSRDNVAETALPGLEPDNCFLEVVSLKIRPQDVCKPQFRVTKLPEKVIAEPLFPSRTDKEVGINGVGIVQFRREEAFVD